MNKVTIEIKLVALLSTLILAGCGIAQRGAISNAYEAMANDDYVLALGKLSEAESYKETSPEIQSEISFLRAFCLEREGKYYEAMGLYAFIIKKYPETNYAIMAKGRINRKTSRLEIEK